jgi:hypothetical protein
MTLKRAPNLGLPVGAFMGEAAGQSQPTGPRISTPPGGPAMAPWGCLGGLAEGGVHHAQRRSFHPFDVAFAARSL